MNRDGRSASTEFKIGLRQPKKYWLKHKLKKKHLSYCTFWSEWTADSFTVLFYVLLILIIFLRFSVFVFV